MSKRPSGWENCGFFIEDHPELTCIATVEKGEVILTREGMAQQDAHRPTVDGRGKATRESGATRRKNSETETARCQRRREKGTKDTGPNSAAQRLLTAPGPVSNALLSAQERSALAGAIDDWLAHLSQVQQKSSREAVEMTAMLATPLPPTLPLHITALGEQRQLVTGLGRRWMGCARATPKELCSLKGIVIYDETISCFLSEDEAREVFVALGWLLVQLSSLQIGDAQAAEEPKQ